MLDAAAVALRGYAPRGIDVPLRARNQRRGSFIFLEVLSLEAFLWFVFNRPQPEENKNSFVKHCDLIFVKNPISAVGFEQERYFLLYVFFMFLFLE